ncbi:ABC transporter permease [Prevotella sp. 10(H)]|uniref:ABC transporter permease n=1 Tax=Prevotella sp. 10(H) TaxID=1158294 RepID=UPI0004A77B4C|nr:ABC transporter permease [Prevotella sp. 10(H)]
MKFILRNFLYVLRRFKSATILNIFGLSVAFASFMIIMMQVDHDVNFNKNVKDFDRIFRAEVAYESGAHTVIARPLAELLFESSPAIVAGTFTDPGPGNRLFKVTDKNGTKNIFLENSFKVSEFYADVFHFDMLEGSDKALSEPNKLLIPESVAKKIFGEQSALNQQMESEEKTVYTIGGVFKDFPKNSSLRNVIYYKIDDNENKDNWGNQNYSVFIRVSSPEVVTGLFENMKKKMPSDMIKDLHSSNINLRFTSLEESYYIKNVSFDSFPKSSRQTIAVLFAIAFVIVIIAGVNFTNFSMALTPARIKSINTQKVMGATTTQLRRTLLIEAICTSLIAFILSILLVKLITYTPLTELLNADMNLSNQIPVISISAVLSLGIGLLSGIYPAFYMTSFPPALVLKGSFGLSDKGKTMRSILIGFQFVASLALIISAGLMNMQNRFMQNSPLGYDKEALIIVNSNNKLVENWDLFKNKIRTYSEIENASNATAVLGSGEHYMGWGRKYKDNDINFQCIRVEYDFLDMMDIEIKEGRNFRQSDSDLKQGVFIFNERAKKEFNLELNAWVDSTEIIGFVPDIKFTSFRISVNPMAFYVDKHFTWFAYAYIKTKKNANPYTAMEHVKSALQTVDPEYPYNVYFYDDVFNRTYIKETNLSKLITTFSLIAILISIVGVFGLVIFESEYKRKEISIRKVLGSSIKEILILFNKTYVKILAICFIIAAPIAYYIIDRWLENFAYRMPIPWWVFPASAVLIFIIVAITVTWQSWRTAISNPVDSLKNE